jgi:hypothetical protein
MNLSSFALKENNIDLCNTISDNVIQNNCKLDVVANDALNKKDISKCDILTNSDIKNDCKDTTIFRLAKITKDKSRCDKLEKNRQNLCIDAMNEKN